MTDQMSGSAILSILETIPKLSDQEGYPAWKRSMRDSLQIMDLWTWIADKTTAPVAEASAIEVPPDDVFTEGAQTALTKAQINALKQHTDGHNKACAVLRFACEGSAFTEIEDMDNAAEAWNHLEKIYKPKGRYLLNDTFRQLFNLTLTDCSGSADYVTQFRGIVNKLQSFSPRLGLDENLLIYLFHTNLGPDHSSYLERYAQDHNHDPFAEDGTARYTLREAMQHFQYTNGGGAVASLAAVCPPRGRGTGPVNGKRIPDSVQPTTNGMAVITKTVKFCNHCKKPRHTEEECRTKHPHLRAQDNKRSKARKRTKNESGDDSEAKPSFDN